MHDFLANIVTTRTYASENTDGYFETWDQTVDRWEDMHHTFFAGNNKLLNMFHADVVPLVKKKIVLPSLRSLQFGGSAVLSNHTRMYNCSYLPLHDFRAFGELMYVLMCGTGAGLGVHTEQIESLPIISIGNPHALFRIPDSKEGWADSIIKLMENPLIHFIYDDIRPNGAPLSSGGTASGPDSLMECHELIRSVLIARAGSRLTTADAADIACMIADVVVVGGVRRAALIILFSQGDKRMINFKAGSWWDDAPWRARANITEVFNPETATYEQFGSSFDHMVNAGWGEPAHAWLKDQLNYGVNPCVEISLRNFGFCNLSTNVWPRALNHGPMEAMFAATVIGTMQAAYTDFSYLRPEWKRNAEEEALLGVSFTGLAYKFPEAKLLQDLARVAKRTNNTIAKLIGINPAMRIGCVKPEGSTSASVGTTSGLHFAHSEYILRHVTANKDHPLCRYLVPDHNNLPPFVKQSVIKPGDWAFAIPIHYADTDTIQTKGALDLMQRAISIHDNWIKPTHRSGANTHNTSITVAYKPEEVEDIKAFCWANRKRYTAFSFLPLNDVPYPQLPFTTIDESTYNQLKSEIQPHFDAIDWTKIPAGSDNLGALKREVVACGAGGCELT